MIWPVRHSRFEDMCALAITGQLGGAQMCELDEHIADCKPCREYLESVAQVSGQAMPLLADKHGPEPKVLPPQGMRERFRARLASETNGSEASRAFRPFAVPDASAQFPSRQAVKVGVQANQSSRGSTLVPSSPWRFVAVATASVIIAAGAYYAGARKRMQPSPQLAKVIPIDPVIPPKSPTPGIRTNLIEPDRVNELERRKSELETQLVSMKQELAAAETDRESLSKELTAAKEKLAVMTIQSANATTGSTPIISQQEDRQTASLQAQVDSLNQRLAQSQVKFEIQKQTSDELAAKLDATAADLQREHDLKSAKSEMGELVAARNLHIVDVYDADPNGKRQRSFGRVFYIEGKSLVFYAYDLDDSRQFKANVVFHVWGGKAGAKEVTHSLGILQKDDASQNRWAMTFDDPHVLGQINSVFVTAESASKHYDEPHGKKVLYAYFGSQPNHP